MRRLLLLVLAPLAVIGLVAWAIMSTATDTAVEALSATGSGLGGGGGCQAGAPVQGGSGGGTTVASLDADQHNNATTIIQVGQQQNVGAFGEQIAIATAMQESKLHNLDHGDRDSLGLFQQRPSMGWGTPAQILDPRYAATQFYTHLKTVPGWQQMPLTVAAQAVQRSGFPGAYAQWTNLAADLVKQGGGGTASTGCAGNPGLGAGGPAVEGAIKYALAQQGKPYVWGATGPDSFDCSGLMLRAWGSVGVNLPRTSTEQFVAGAHVPLAQAQRGDLLFWSSDGTPGGIHHVAMYLGNNQIVEAQQTGVPVHIRSIKLNPPEPELFSQVVRLGAVTKR